jgi:glycosyltransferase involved in cell wall biosynthesis
VTLSILHVLQDEEGGAVTQTRLLASRLVERGGYATVVAPSRAQAAPVRSAQLVRLAREADLVHAHGTRAAAWAFPALAVRPSVVTYHGLHLLRRPAGRTYRAAGRLLVRGVSAAADAVICVSPSEAAEVKALRVRPSKISVIENAVAERSSPTSEERRLARDRLGLAETELAVLFVGRLEDPKDPLLALRVADALSREGVVLIVAGDGTLGDTVRRAAGPNVRVLGRRDDVPELLAAADVVLSTSSWEGLPYALLEALWACRPIVASDVPGNRDAVGDAGILVQGRDASVFAEAVLRLRDPAMRAELGARARERAEAWPSRESMLARTEDVYSRVLDARSA